MSMLDERTITVSAFAGVTKGRRVRRVVTTLLSLVMLVAVGTSAAYIAFMNHDRTVRFTHVALLPDPGTVLARGEIVPARDAAPAGVQNILLIGSDSRSHLVRAGADLIVLMHIGADGRRVHLVHFPGNMYVDVPGRGEDRLSNAYAYGGAPLLVRTLQTLLGLPIDHVVLVGFGGFREMTDALGGVSVTVARAITLPGYATLSKGTHRLDGTAALGFVRMLAQPGENDIARGRRQLAVLEALLLRSLNNATVTNPIQLAELLGAASRNIAVDNTFSADEMRSVAQGLHGLVGTDVVTLTAPITSIGRNLQGVPIDIVNVPRMTELASGLRRDDMAGFGAG